MQVFALQSREIAQYWEHVEPHLRRFEAETLLLSVEDIRANCEALRQQLWIAVADSRVIGVLITEIYSTLRGSICAIWALAGTQSEQGQILTGFEEIRKFARDKGCIALEIRGRKGWERLIPDARRVGVILEVPCEPRQFFEESPEALRRERARNDVRPGRADDP